MNSKLLLIITFVFLSFQACIAQKNENKSITQNGMTIEWEVIGDNLKMTMIAPTTGWVAIGLNPKSQLAGSSFMMGRVIGNNAEVVDYYTIKPGDVHPVTKLGGQSAVGKVTGIENKGSTSVTFELALNPGGKYHHKLVPGSHFFMHIAYSQEDDFAHHSMMRTMVEIKI